MDKIANSIPVRYTDSRINELIKSAGNSFAELPIHFNQNEEFFVKLPVEIEIPQIPVHHDIRNEVPEAAYLESVQNIVASLIPHMPGFFKDTTYFFDPAEVLRPCFFQIFKTQEQTYLYLGRLDLSFRTHDAEILDHGSNDFTPAYKTRNFYLDCDIIPLEEVVQDGGKITAFALKQYISQTWIGETGRGYFVQGIWIDHELTKFFSRLFIPEGKSIYPYYPFTCKYRSLCHALIDCSPAGRKQGVPLLKKALEFLEPAMDSIQKQLKREPFSPDLPVYKALKLKVNTAWQRPWMNIRFKRYLNSQDMKEFVLASQT